MPSSLAIALLVGLALAGLITTLLPANLISGSLSSGPLAFLLATAISLPLYICATASIPMAYALITAGFWLKFNPAQMVVSSLEVYDDSDIPGPWDHAMTKKLENPDGSGTYLVTLGNLANVDPDQNAQIKLAKVRFRCKGDCGDPITISTIAGFDTVVGDEGRVYDSELPPFSFIINY